MRKLLLVAASIAFAFGAMLASCAAQASGNGKGISRTAMSGGYTITLKLLPAESFAGPHAEMTWDGGAKPDMLSHSPRPNHHLVAFIKKGGKPLEKGDVRIRYRTAGAAGAGWQTLQVARMHVSGKGLETTHFGNNVHLAPGRYEVQVTVDAAPPQTFHFTVAGD